MRLSILWKLLVPIVLVVSTLASGLLWVHLRLLDESFHRRASTRLALATEIVKAQQHGLEERTVLVARDLARDRAIIRLRALPIASAIDELLRGAGTQWDPRLVECFAVNMRHREKPPRGQRAQEGQQRPARV